MYVYIYICVCVCISSRKRKKRNHAPYSITTIKLLQTSIWPARPARKPPPFRSQGGIAKAITIEDALVLFMILQLAASHWTMRSFRHPKHESKYAGMRWTLFPVKVSSRLLHQNYIYHTKRGLFQWTKKVLGHPAEIALLHAILRIAKWQISGVQCVQQYLKHPEATLFTNHVDKL